MHQSKQYASQNYGSCDSTFRLWKSSQQQIKHHSSEHQLLNEPYKADRNKEKDDVVKCLHITMLTQKAQINA